MGKATVLGGDRQTKGFKKKKKKETENLGIAVAYVGKSLLWTYTRGKKELPAE